MYRKIALLLALAGLSTAASAQTTSKTLDMYYIDTEGGQATLFVAPSGQTVLIDTGNTGARDPGRIIEVTRAAGVKQLDYLLITHYHGDHVGGYLELSKQIPILHYVDHGQTVQPEQVFDSRTAYDAAVKTHPHTIAKPGDKLPIAGLDWTIVSSAGKVLSGAMTGEPGAGLANPYCADYKTKEITVDLENAQSVGSVIRYGKFRTVDLGDLLWNWEGQLACPINKIGVVDEMLTTHHGLAWSGVPALVYALRPQVIVMNNGVRKGAAPEYLQTLESSPGLEDLWQLHWSANLLLEHNVAGVRIANIETPETIADVLTHPPGAIGPGVRPPDIGNPNHAPAYWIKVSAQADGSFTVTNSRNGFSKTYKHRG